MTAKETFYHVTVLSNFARGFDKYSRGYSKARIPESTYPDRFFLLRRGELGIGIQKASHLLEKLGLAGNRLIVLETELDAALLQINTANGRGQFIHSNQITLSRLYEIEHDENVVIQLRPVAVEDVMAASLRLLNREFLPFVDIRPRAISFLPVALACQAKCPFCFSKASVSSDQVVAKPDWEKVSVWLDRAQTHWAERAVITGGGEPTLLPAAMLQLLVAACANRFDKVVLITNGHTLAMASEADQVLRLGSLYDAGLRVLAISRHHFDAEQNERLMHLHTPVEALIRNHLGISGNVPAQQTVFLLSFARTRLLFKMVRLVPCRIAGLRNFSWSTHFRTDHRAIWFGTRRRLDRQSFIATVSHKRTGSITAPRSFGIGFSVASLPALGVSSHRSPCPRRRS